MHMATNMRNRIPKARIHAKGIYLAMALSHARRSAKSSPEVGSLRRHCLRGVFEGKEFEVFYFKILDFLQLRV